jgi:uncharacterized phage protein (TIGR01671 family)
MNRPIKFRVWDKDSNEMTIYDFSEQSFLETYKNPQDSTKLKYRTSFDSYNENELMQFTGLHDCDGKDIFECDIVKITDEYKSEGFIGSYVEVEFEYGTFCFFVDKKDGRDFYPLCVFDCKITGNVFEGLEDDEFCKIT